MRIGPLSTAFAEISPETGTFNACELAGIVAERAGDLPSGLLLAIGRVESGKWDPARGQMVPWPWTMNAAGRGQWFETKDDAAATVRTLLDAGTRSIDVGCFQISLLYHPAAFTSLEQAFDPDANARYAARFLLSLFGRAGSWEAAVEAYHSADPARGFAYRQQVFSAWAAAAPPPSNITVRTGVVPLSPAGSPSSPSPVPFIMAGVQVWMPVGTGATIVAMPPQPVSAPSELDPPRETLTAAPVAPLPTVSYRAMPRR